jgi:hypothetical protein
MLNFIAETADHDDLIDFSTSANNVDDGATDPLVMPDDVLLN